MGSIRRTDTGTTGHSLRRGKPDFGRRVYAESKRRYPSFSGQQSDHLLSGQKRRYAHSGIPGTNQRPDGDRRRNWGSVFYPGSWKCRKDYHQWRLDYCAVRCTGLRWDRRRDRRYRCHNNFRRNNNGYWQRKRRWDRRKSRRHDGHDQRRNSDRHRRSRWGGGHHRNRGIPGKIPG